MNLAEVTRALRQLRVSDMAATIEARLLQAQSEKWAALDLISALVQDELTRRPDRLLERRIKQADFRDAGKTLDTFDFDFNKKMDRRLVFELAAGHFVEKREDALFLGPPGTGKSNLAQAIGHAAIRQGHKVLYRQTHVLLEELAEASIDGSHKDRIAALHAVPLLLIDDLGMRKLPATAAELELVMRRYERKHAHHLEPPGGRLGQDPWRRARCERHARPAPAPRPRTQVRPEQLANQACRLAAGGCGRLES